MDNDPLKSAWGTTGMVPTFKPDHTTGLKVLDLTGAPWRLKVEFEGERELMMAIQASIQSTIARYRALKPGEGFIIDLGDGASFAVRRPVEFTVT